VYLIHGYGFNDDQWVRLGITEFADRLIATGEIPPIIMVMPYDPKPSAPPKNQFGEALVSDLVPLIDTVYRTIPDRQHRNIGGISRGGNWAIHLGLSHWDVFGAIGAHSASLFIWDGQPEIEEWLQQIPPEIYPRIYLDIGESDKFAARILWLEGFLNDFGVPHEFHLFPGNHTESYWIPHIEGYLRWYVEEW
jgi:enterochelin esterase-like enzyme